MKIEINTHQIKRFLLNAAPIRSSGILPIHGFLFLNDNFISKTNDHAFITMEISPTGQTLLLDERILSAFIKGTTSDKFTIEVKGERITLSDGINKPYFAVENPTNFPKFPETEDKAVVKLDESTLKAVGVASRNVLTGSRINDPFEFVHVKDGHVFASDRNRFYFCKVEGIPDMIIDYEAANVISSFGSVSYFTGGNFNFFQAGSTLYAFKTTEAKTPAFMPVANSFSKEPYMEFSSSELLNFLDLATSLSPSPELMVTLKGNFLSFSDDNYNVGNEREIEVEGDYKPQIDFLPKVFAPFFKSINKERIRVSPIIGKDWGLSVWSDDDTEWFGMVAGVVDPSKQ